MSKIPDLPDVPKLPPRVFGAEEVKFSFKGTQVGITPNELIELNNILERKKTYFNMLTDEEKETYLLQAHKNANIKIENSMQGQLSKIVEDETKKFYNDPGISVDRNIDKLNKGESVGNIIKENARRRLKKYTTESLPPAPTNPITTTKSMPPTINEKELDEALSNMDFEKGGKKKTKKGKKTKKKKTRSKKQKGGDPPMTPLEAIRAGLVDRVEEMIDSGRDVNQPSQNGFTLLHYAVHFMEKQERLRSDMRMVNMLIEKGADVNSEANGGLTPLHIAAARDNIHLIRLLIEKGADKNKETAVGDTPLIVAAKRDNKDAIKALIDGGVDINHRNNNGETPVFLVSRGLHAALSPSQSYRVLRVLIDSGADIQIENNQGISPLWIATLKGNLNLVYLLLEAGANVESFNAEGRTPLAKAAETGKPRTVELLYDYGAEIESQDNEQNTPLMLAANNGHKDVVKFLIEKDAFGNHKNEEELTAVDLAQREGHLEIVNMLRKHNINNEIRGYKRDNIPSLATLAYQQAPSEVDQLINDPVVGMKRPFSRLGGKRKTRKSTNKKKKQTRSKKGGSAAPAEPFPDVYYKEYNFLQAASYGFLEGLQKYLDEGVDVNMTYPDGHTALMVASYKGHANIVSMLLDRGADVNAKTINETILGYNHYRSGSTALVFAIKRGHTEVVQILLQNGADVNDRDDDSNTVIMSVIEERYLERRPDMMSILLENGAEVNAVRNDGTTALMGASSHGHTVVVPILLQNEADVNAKDNNDNTALMFASYYGYLNIVFMLLQNGADVNVKNILGNTAIDYANEGGHIEIQNILKQYMLEKIIERTVERQELVKEMDRRGIHDNPAEIGMNYLGGKRKTKKSKRSQKTRKSMKNKHSVRK